MRSGNLNTVSQQLIYSPEFGISISVRVLDPSSAWKRRVGRVAAPLPYHFVTLHADSPRTNPILFGCACGAKEQQQSSDDNIKHRAL